MGTSQEDYFAEIARRKRELYGKRNIISAAAGKGKLLGINGRMDYINEVVPFCYCAQKDVVEPTSNPCNLEPYHVVLVGCPGELSPAWINPVENYVKRGGYLVTTDWSLENLIPKVAPGFISAGGKGDGMYSIRLVADNHPFLADVNPDRLGQWDIETSSDLVRIENSEMVKVLIDSPKLQESKKHGAIMVTFPLEKGHIVHFVSHLHLQKSSEDDKYNAAFILTNIIDEAIRQRYSIAPPKIKIRPAEKSSKKISVKIKRSIRS
jgi:hypothetical protein